MADEKKRGFRGIAVEALFRVRPQVDMRAVEALVRRSLPDTQLVGEAPSQLFFHHSSMLQLKDGTVPIQTVVWQADTVAVSKGAMQDTQQSYDWDGAADAVQRSPHSVLLMEMMALGAPPTDRLRIFHTVLRAFVQVTKPDALWWASSGRVTEPAGFLAATEPGLKPNPTVGAINVRMFRIENTPGDVLMDTMGMSVFDLPDLQCHFHGLEAGLVGGKLFNTAAYLYEHGPVIEGGHTIAGIPPEAKWKCQFEDSLVGPERVVLDLNPGPRFAAGGRS